MAPPPGACVRPTRSRQLVVVEDVCTTVLDTTTLTFIPSILCPGTGQKMSYLPFLKVTLRSALLPGAISAWPCCAGPVR